MSDIDSNMLERLHQQSEEIMRLRAEIERLRAQWQDSDPEKLYQENKSLKVEIERLKAALREIAENTNHTSDYCRRIARAALEGKP